MYYTSFMSWRWYLKLLFSNKVEISHFSFFCCIGANSVTYSAQNQVIALFLDQWLYSFLEHQWSFLLNFSLMSCHISVETFAKKLPMISHIFIRNIISITLLFILQAFWVSLVMPNLSTCTASIFEFLIIGCKCIFFWFFLSSFFLIFHASESTCTISLQLFTYLCQPL